MHYTNESLLCFQNILTAETIEARETALLELWSLESNKAFLQLFKSLKTIIRTAKAPAVAEATVGIDGRKTYRYPSFIEKENAGTRCSHCTKPLAKDEPVAIWQLAAGTKEYCLDCGYPEGWEGRFYKSSPTASRLAKLFEKSPQNMRANPFTAPAEPTPAPAATDLMIRRSQTGHALGVMPNHVLVADVAAVESVRETILRRERIQPINPPLTIPQAPVESEFDTLFADPMGDASFVPPAASSTPMTHPTFLKDRYDATDPQDAFFLEERSATTPAEVAQ